MSVKSADADVEKSRYIGIGNIGKTGMANSLLISVICVQTLLFRQ